MAAPPGFARRACAGPPGGRRNDANLAQTSIKEAVQLSQLGLELQVLLWDQSEKVCRAVSVTYHGDRPPSESRGVSAVRT